MVFSVSQMATVMLQGFMARPISCGQHHALENPMKEIVMSQSEKFYSADTSVQFKDQPLGSGSSECQKF